MATTLEEVKNNLPSDASGQGWNDAKVTGLVDQGMSLAEIMMTYWNWRAGSVHKYVSVSESGSTRSLSDVYNNAVEMLKFWSDQVNREKALVNDLSRRPISFGRIKRV